MIYVFRSQELLLKNGENVRREGSVKKLTSAFLSPSNLNSASLPPTLVVSSVIFFPSDFEILIKILSQAILFLLPSVKLGD